MGAFWVRFGTVLVETNKSEKRFGKIRDEENMLAVKKLMLESLSNFRFRGTALNYEEFTIALENIIIDKVSTAPTSRQKNINTTAPMEVGIAAKDDSESSREEGDERIMGISLQVEYNRAGKGNLWSERLHTGTHRGTQVAKVARMRIVIVKEVMSEL